MKDPCALSFGDLFSGFSCGLILLLSACGLPDASGSAVDAPALTKSFRGVLEEKLLLSGELYSVDATDICVPKTREGNLRISWMIPDGTEVRKTEKILEFDNTSFIEAVEKKRIELDGALRDLEQQKARSEATLIEAELRLKRARIARKKAELLAEIPEKLLSRKEYQENRIALHRAVANDEKASVDRDSTKKAEELDIQVAEIKIRGIRRELLSAQKAIEELIIEAPEDGIVIVADHPWEGRKFKEGDTPWPGLTVLRMPKLKQMAVKARLFDVDDGRLLLGMKVLCLLDTYPQDVFPAAIRDITPIAQEIGPFSMRRAFDVMIDLDDVDSEKMRPGMSVRVEAAEALPGTHLLVPRWAIETGKEYTRVHLKAGGWKTVELGPCSAQLCIVEKGLEEGVALAHASEEGK